MMVQSIENRRFIHFLARISVGMLPQSLRYCQSRSLLLVRPTRCVRHNKLWSR